MEFHHQICGYIQQMRRIGYSQAAITQIISHYSGYPDWAELPDHKQRRLVADLRRHVHIARRWQYAVTGYLQ